MPRPSLPNALYITAPDTPTCLRSGAYRRCGATNAEAQIQSAIDRLHATNDGGIVCLAPGTFNTNNPIRLYQGITLTGSGMAATQLKLLAGSYCDAIQHFGEYQYSGTATGGTTLALTDTGQAWTDNALEGLYVYIYGGSGAGQRRLITHNDHDTIEWAGAGATIDNTSLYRIGKTTQLFMRVSDMTIFGNKATNAAFTGTASSGTTTTLTLTGAGWTLNQWADRVTCEVTGGTNAGEVRRVLSNTSDTLTFDGPFTLACDATTAFSLGGCGIAMYGPSAYDLMLTDVWTDDMTHHGVYCEETWGHVYKNLISEYNGMDGLRTNISPYQRGTTGAWPATTGVSPMEGPKMTLSKLVVNLRHGVFLGEYTYSSLIGECEVAGGGAGSYGITMAASAVDNTITGCRVASSTGPAAGGINLASTGNTAVGNIIRSGAGDAALTYGIRIGSSGNTVEGNVISLAAGTPISDTDGRNMIANNQTITTVQRLRVRGKKSMAKGAGDYVTLNPQLGTAPAACQITPLITPADAQTRGVGTWSVAGYPVPTATAIQIDCSGTLSTGTTLNGAVTGNASPQTISVTDAASIKVGGTVNVAAGGGTAEDVLITAVAGNNITGTFLYSHNNGTAVAPLYTFLYDVGYNDRGTVAA